MRYESKFVFPAYAYGDLQARLLSSRFFFREIYQERRINNIYLDSADYKNLFDNLRGVQNREKHRIRWYGQQSQSNQPFLEYKIKQGELGYKEYYAIPSFSLDTTFDYNTYLDLIKRAARKKMAMDKIMYREIFNEIPTLYNTYLRRYFLSADEKFRITLDRVLKYKAANRWFDNLPEFRENKMVVELKYENRDISTAGAIMQELGLRLSRNSKYVIGMQGLYFNTFEY